LNVTSPTLSELEKLVDAPARAASDIQILQDGAAAFPAMLELIDGARTRIRFENFIFAGDETGQRFADALASAARRGVDVRVLFDPVGTMMVKGGSIARVLLADGVETRPFSPFSPFAPRSWAGLKHRDHRKTLTVDGDTTVVGGLCISNHWASPDFGGSGWRDTALCVRGRVSLDVEAAFEALWQRSEAPDRPEEAGTVTVASPPAAILAADRPGARRLARLYARLAETAERSIEITDAYLVLPPLALDALVAAAQRGVSVRMLLPGRNNTPLREPPHDTGTSSCSRPASRSGSGTERWCTPRPPSWTAK
jgi:cardiolipin synthase